MELKDSGVCLDTVSSIPIYGPPLFLGDEVLPKIGVAIGEEEVKASVASQLSPSCAARESAGVMGSQKTCGAEVTIKLT